jgi:hypothetical protein
LRSCSFSTLALAGYAAGKFDLLAAESGGNAVTEGLFECHTAQQANDYVFSKPRE